MRYFLTHLIVEFKFAPRNLANVHHGFWWFTFQKRLMVNKGYSFSACMTDCRVRFYIEFCKCIPFYFPHFDKSLKNVPPSFFFNENFIFAELPMFTKVPWCSLEHVDCMNKIRTIISSIQPPKRSNFKLDSENNKPIGLNCSCMPGCRELVNFYHFIIIRKCHFSFKFSPTLLLLFQRYETRVSSVDHRISPL